MWDKAKNWLSVIGGILIVFFLTLFYATFTRKDNTEIKKNLDEVKEKVKKSKEKVDDLDEERKEDIKTKEELDKKKEELDKESAKTDKKFSNHFKMFIFILTLLLIINMPIVGLAQDLGEPNVPDDYDTLKEKYLEMIQIASEFKQQRDGYKSLYEQQSKLLERAYKREESLVNENENKDEFIRELQSMIETLLKQNSNNMQVGAGFNVVPMHMDYSGVMVFASYNF